MVRWQSVQEADQPAECLHAGAVVVGPSFVDFQPATLVAVLPGPACFTALAGAARDHAAESFPVLR